MARDSFGSRFGALVALAGSAVGLGNLWRFPYLVGENGGAAFIIIYVLMSFIICLPIFICEFVVGRRSQENAYSAFRDLSGGSKWKYVGVMTVIIPLIVTSYYSVVGGWSVQYLFKAVTFEFTKGETLSAMSTMFSDYVSSPWLPLVGHTVFLLATAVIVAAGMVHTPSFLGRSMQVKVSVLLEVRLPLIIEVLDELDWLGPERMSKSVMLPTLKLLALCVFTVYDNLNVSPITTALGASAVKVTSSVCA